MNSKWKDAIAAELRGRLDLALRGRGRGCAKGGLIEPGNIDLTNRPIVQNPDGSISTVRTIGVEFDGRHVNIPTVSPDARIMSDDEAIGLYREFGKHLGIYDSQEAAGRAAKALHEEQERMYVPRRGAVPGAGSKRWGREK